MANKNPFLSLDLTALQIAFDHAEERNMILQPDPNGDPSQSAYLRYPPKALTELLTCGRIPFCKVKFSTQSNEQPIRCVYHKQTLDHLFNFVCGQTFTYTGANWKGSGWVRTLDTVDPKYWSLLDSDGERVKNPNRFARKRVQAIAVITNVHMYRSHYSYARQHLLMWMKPPFTRENISRAERYDSDRIPLAFVNALARGLGTPIVYEEIPHHRLYGTGRLLTLEDCLAAKTG